MTPDATPVTDNNDAPAPDVMLRLAEVCERAALGDLEARVVGISDDPAVARLSRGINHMLDMADSFVREASAVMEHCGRDEFHRPILLPGLKGGYRQSAVVINNAGLKMRESRDQIVFAGQLANDNLASVSSVASACSQMDSTSRDISRQASESAGITQGAVGEVTRARDAVDAMNTAVKMIDTMVTLINQVAHQTNLLALNATIEAARAGDAGKGFAVVASEVKELSRNTAKATADISDQVERIQQTAGDVSRIIGHISESIRRIDEHAVSIVRAAGDQVDATAGITRSIGEVARNTEQVSTRINQRVGTARG